MIHIICHFCVSVDGQLKCEKWIRDDDNKKAALVETRDRVRCALQELHLAGLVEKTWVFDDGAVAIEKDGGVAGGHQPSAVCFQRGNDGFDLVRKNRARVEQHATPRHARNDRWVERAKVREVGVR